MSEKPAGRRIVAENVIGVFGIIAPMASSKRVLELLREAKQLAREYYELTDKPLDDVPHHVPNAVK
jgi:hypothetical protein